MPGLPCVDRFPSQDLAASFDLVNSSSILEINASAKPCQDFLFVPKDEKTKDLWRILIKMASSRFTCNFHHQFSGVYRIYRYHSKSKRGDVRIARFEQVQFLGIGSNRTDFHQFSRA